MPAYESLVYPTNLDFFREVQDGYNPENLIRAELVNKLQNAVASVQSHVRYTARTSAASGSLIYTVSASYHFTEDTSTRMHRLPVAVPVAVANQYFGGRPFDRQWGCFAHAWGYKLTSTGRTYFLVSSCARVPQESGLSAFVVAMKQGTGTTRWRKGDRLEVNLMLVRPY